MRATGVVAGALVVCAVAVPGAAVAAPEELLLMTPRVAQDHALTVQATVPGVLSAMPVAADAFSATQAGRPVPVTSARLVDGPAELVVVLDAAGDAASLAAEQSAAADLLRALPPQLPTTVLPGGDRTTARGALDTLGALQPRSGGLLDGLPAPPSVPRFVVVLARCEAVQAERRALTGDSEVSVLATGAGCGDAAVRLAGGQPRVVRTDLDATGLLAGVDDVDRELMGQYTLQTAPGLGPEPVEVTVRVGTAVASATVDLPAPGPVAAAGPSDATDSSSSGPLVAGTVLAVLAALALGLELLARRRAAPA